MDVTVTVQMRYHLAGVPPGSSSSAGMYWNGRSGVERLARRESNSQPSDAGRFNTDGIEGAPSCVRLAPFVPTPDPELMGRRWTGTLVRVRAPRGGGRPEAALLRLDAPLWDQGIHVLGFRRGPPPMLVRPQLEDGVVSADQVGC